MIKLKRSSYVLLTLLIVFVLVQFIPVSKVNPTSEASADMINLLSPPTNIANAIKNSCYDCHSNNTVYPWYASVAPVSWVVVNHVKEGRSELNFSEWANLDPKKAAHKLDECKEVIEEGEMPLAGYVALHAKAKLDETTKQALLTWINEQLTPQTPVANSDDSEELEHNED